MITMKTGTFISGGDIKKMHTEETFSLLYEGQEGEYELDRNE